MSHRQLRYIGYIVVGMATVAVLTVKGRLPYAQPQAFAGESPSALPALVVLSDTQYYSSKFPEVFASQTRWIVQNQSAQNVVGVLHLGDIVDKATDDVQWRAASEALRMLDARVPYLLVPGNHDADLHREGRMDVYFAPVTMPWITGTMVPWQVENSYMLIDIGPQRWLVMGLEFAPRKSSVEWANRVLKKYPNLPAIVVTHAYLYADGTRYGTEKLGFGDAVRSDERFSAEEVDETPDEGTVDGEQLWRSLIRPNSNVRLVLCSHDNGVARLHSTHADGSVVHELLSNYQWFDEGTAHYAGGSGYLRIMKFDYAKKEIRVETYSPYLGHYLTDDENQFVLSLDV